MKANYVPQVLDAGSPLEARKGAHPKTLAGYVDGAATEIRRMKLGDYLVDHWLPSVEFEVEPTTLQGYRTNVLRHVVPAIGDTAVEDLTREGLKRFYSDLLSRNVPGTQKPLSKGSVCRIHSAIHRGLRLLVEAGVLMSNPASGARPRTRKLDHYEIRIWSPNELSMFLAQTTNSPLGSIWFVMAHTGIRRGEALGLRWHDFHAQMGVLSVRRALNQVGSKIYVSAPKSAQSRVIELDSATVECLREHRDRLEHERARLEGAKVSSSDYVFVSDDGTAHVPARISKAFQAAVVEHGLPRIRLHDLRHTHASHLIESGANPKVVQERLGHADVVITLNLYSHLFPTTQRDAIRQLERFYSTR